MPKEKQTPLKQGETAKGFKQDIKTVPKTVEVREELYIDFVKTYNFHISDFTKRVNFLIKQDIENLRATNPEIFNNNKNGK